MSASTTTSRTGLPKASLLKRPPVGTPWIMLAAAVLALVLPTYVRLNDSLWQQEAYEHGPIIVALFWWLIWRARSTLPAPQGARSPGPALALILAGLAVYFVGRTQHLALFEVASHLPLMAGVVMLGWGSAGLRALWFPLGFLIFLVPLPPFIIVAMTSTLKEWVSVAAEYSLYHLGYSIARDGVVISIGPYRMLVADACSGLNSMYSLSAIGLLYLYLTYKPLWLRNVLLLLAIIPIAIIANIFRVMTLILLTFHFGDEVGQGFLHHASGVAVFVIAIAGLVLIDGLILRALARAGRASPKEPT